MNLRDSNLVNELFGNRAGDQRIIETGRRLSAVAPESAVVAHLGSDEFAIFTPLGSTEPATFTAALARAVNQPLRMSGQLVPMSADFGYVVSAATENDPAKLIDAARFALQEARKSKQAPRLGSLRNSKPCASSNEPSTSISKRQSTATNWFCTGNRSSMVPTWICSVGRLC